VVGWYFDSRSSQNHGFITQVPEPASAMLVGTAGLGLLARRWFARQMHARSLCQFGNRKVGDS
jgi:hypothetical protein